MTDPLPPSPPALFLPPGMRACTAALIELRYNARTPQESQDYFAEVEFISREEWESELDGLLEDLQQQDGRGARSSALHCFFAFMYPAVLLRAARRHTSTLCALECSLLLCLARCMRHLTAISTYTYIPVSCSARDIFSRRPVVRFSQLS